MLQVDGGLLRRVPEKVGWWTTRNGPWEIQISNLAVIGEYTFEAWPGSDDYIIVWIQTNGARTECPLSEPGLETAIEHIRAVSGTPVAFALFNRTDFAHRVAWPAQLAGRPLFDESDKAPFEALRFSKRVRLYLSAVRPNEEGEALCPRPSADATPADGAGVTTVRGSLKLSIYQVALSVAVFWALSFVLWVLRGGPCAGVVLVISGVVAVSNGNWPNAQAVASAGIIAGSCAFLGLHWNDDNLVEGRHSLPFLIQCVLVLIGGVLGMAYAMVQKLIASSR